MTGLDPRLRVTVLGNSLGVLCVPPPTSPDDTTFPLRLERNLRARGLDVTVDNQSRLFELLPAGARRYLGGLNAAWPDLLLIQYGIVDIQPNALPTTIVRSLTDGSPPGRGPAGWWRRWAVPRVWPVARRYQQVASTRDSHRTHRVSPERFEAELRRLVRAARSQGTVVGILDVNRPGSRLVHFFPGIEQRWAAHQSRLRATVADIDDPDVRLVETSAVTAGFGDDPLLDGLHWSAEQHAAVAELLTETFAADLVARRDARRRP